MSEYFHTQEHRVTILTSPIKCTRDDAWLGEGYYFWKDEIQAHIWGRESKKRTKFYDIYVSIIDKANIIDTVFNEDDYNKFVVQIEKIAKNILKNTKKTPTIKEVNEYIRDRGLWKDIDGVQFQDIPKNNEYVIVTDFFYKKRIQLAIYNIKCIKSFKLHMKKGACDGN